MKRIDHEVHRRQLVGVQPACIVQRLNHREVEVIHKDEHPIPRMLDHVLTLGHQILQNGVLGAILAVEPHQREHQGRHDHDD